MLALLFVENETQSKLLAGLAFTIGFIALTLARSELFTEDFLVPVMTVIARQARTRMLLRLWVGTLVANLVGGWLFTYLVMKGFPQFGETAIKAGSFYVDLGLGGKAFSLAVIGGAVITLMTWMQHTTESAGVRLVPAITGGFLLAGAQSNHAIVNSLLMFAALHTGHAPFGYPAVGGDRGVRGGREHRGRRRPGHAAAVVPVAAHHPEGAGEPRARCADRRRPAGGRPATVRARRVSVSPAALRIAATYRSSARVCTRWLTGPPSRDSGWPAGRRRAARTRTSPSGRSETTKDSSPLSGWPGSVP